GVIGLTTAIRAFEAGFDVTVIAEIFPGDEKSIKTASCWAGADHISGIAADDALMYRLERETFDVFMGLLKKDPLVPVMVRPHIRYSQTARKNDHFSKFYSDFRILDASELPETVFHGATFSTLCIDVPRYLPYLMKRFLASGGQAFRTKTPLLSLSALLSEKHRPALAPFTPTSELSSTLEPTLNPAAVINCTGLGALSLKDVLDTAMYPTRGEVLLINAPWVQRDCTFHWADGHVSYMIPRQSGDVVLGGTFQADDWHPTSRPETVKLIKERGIEAFPQLLPPAKRGLKDIEDLEVREECVGLRPTRHGGVRIELGSLVVGDTTIPIVHNYGHGGAGYQSSWGSADFAVELLKSVLDM
ncbi:DAO-domain-containing protein, partial [Mycena galopus ATCC 62051]